MAGSPLWLRGTSISESGQHHDEIPLTSVSSGERLDRIIVDFRVQIVSTDSAVLGTWEDRGVLVVLQWVEGAFPVDAPGDIGEANLDSVDVLTSAYGRIAQSQVFTNRYVCPAYGEEIHLDTPVHRVPDGDNVGFVYLTWGLADFAGAGVEVGFAKTFFRILLSSPFA